MTHAAANLRIQTLMIERAPWLFDEGAHMELLRATLGRMLNYQETVETAARLKGLGSTEIMDQMAARIARDVTATGLHRIPKDGPALIVCNHPTGIADAIVLWSALAQRRKDAYFFANRDVLRVLPEMSDRIAPVEWRPEARSRSKTRATLDFAKTATEAGRIGVIFPSGRLAYRKGLRLQERPWLTSAASLARKLNIPIIPVHLNGRNSALFYAFSLMHPTLRDITLFHETLNKAETRYRVHVGQPVHARDLPSDPVKATQLLCARCLGTTAQPLFDASQGRFGGWIKPAQAARVDG